MKEWDTEGSLELMKLLSTKVLVSENAKIYDKLIKAKYGRGEMDIRLAGARWKCCEVLMPVIRILLSRELCLDDFELLAFIILRAQTL